MSPVRCSPPQVGNRRPAADDGHVAQIAVDERHRRLAALAPQDVLRRVHRALHAGLHHARQQLSVVVLHAARVADDPHVGVAGHRQVRLDDHAARPVERGAQRLRSGEARDAGGPHDGRRHRAARLPSITPCASMPDDPRAFAHLDAKPRQRLGARRPAAARERGEHRGPASTITMRARDVSMARNSCLSVWRAISASVPASSTPVGPPPDDDERQQLVAPGRVRLALRPLERQQDAPADRDRVLERLQAWRMLLPFRVTEVGVPRAAAPESGSRSRSAGRRRAPDAARRGPRRVTSPSRTRTLRARRRIQRIGAPISAGESRRRGHLVQQRLKDVVVAAIEQRDAHAACRAASGQPLSPPNPPPTMTTCGRDVSRGPRLQCSRLHSSIRHSGIRHCALIKVDEPMKQSPFGTSSTRRRHGRARSTAPTAAAWTSPSRTAR